MTVLGGFLGAGKTTLLNRILSGAHGVRYAVLINDFGELDVDGSLVAAHGGDTLTFANGCVCCSMGDDLVGAIDRLLDGSRRPDQILVEASGVADPAPIADVATLHPGLSRDLVVVLADAETLRSRYEDRRLRDTVARQLDAADLLVLNKCDRVREGAREAIESWIRDRACAPLVRTVGADIPMELLSAARVEVPAPASSALPAESPESPELRWTDAPAAFMPAVAAKTPAPAAAHPERARNTNAATAHHPEHVGNTNADPAPSGAVPDEVATRTTGLSGHGHGHGHEPGHGFVSRTVPCPDPMNPERLRTALIALAPRVLRAKGFVVPAGGTGGDRLLVQACGRTVELEPRRLPPSPGAAPPPSALVFIGLDDLPDEDELAGAVRQASIRAGSRPMSCSG